MPGPTSSSAGPVSPSPIANPAFPDPSSNPISNPIPSTIASTLPSITNPASPSPPHDQTLAGALTFLGFVISLLAVLYFAVTWLPDVSDWVRFGALGLLAASFAFQGVYVGATQVGRPFFGGPRLRWLRPAMVLYLAALVSGIAADLVFLFGIESVGRPLKVLLNLAVGIGLIVAVARRTRNRT